MTNHLSYWLAALYLPEVGPRTFLRWLAAFDSIEALFCATEIEWRQAGIAEKYFSALQKPDWQAVERDRCWAEEMNQHVITLADADYPVQLKEIADPPLVLYVRGDKSILQRKQIAMVGTRAASADGMKDANRFARALTEAGLVITSGLALGIDGASHRGALAVQGLTIAVTGVGLYHTYPRSHRQLAEDIVQAGGALVSEFPLPMGPLAQHFPRRNRVIAGLSLGVLVVEAALKSGSLITARHALEQGRDIFAIPGSIHQRMARGCHYLIKEGAKLVETPTDVLEEYGLVARDIVPAVADSQTKLAATNRQLLALIGYKLTTIEEILCQSGLTASQVSSILLILELEGYIQSLPGGYIRLGLNK